MKNFVQKITVFCCLFGFITTPSERKKVSISLDYPLLKSFSTYKLYREPKQNIIAIESNVDFIKTFYTRVASAQQQLNQVLAQAQQQISLAREQNLSEESIAQLQMHINQQLEEKHGQALILIQFAQLFPYQATMYKRTAQINNAFQQQIDVNKLLLINLNTWPQIYQQFASQFAQQEQIPPLVQEINNQITKITQRGYGFTALVFNRYDEHFLLYVAVTTLITQLIPEITFPEPSQMALARLKPETKSFFQRWKKTLLVAGAGALISGGILFAAKQGAFQGISDRPQQFAETVFEKSAELGTKAIEKTTEFGKQTLETGKNIGKQAISGELIKKGGRFAWEHKIQLGMAAGMGAASPFIAQSIQIGSEASKIVSEKVAESENFLEGLEKGLVEVQKQLPGIKKEAFKDITKTQIVLGAAQGVATTALGIGLEPVVSAKLGSLMGSISQYPMMNKVLSSSFFKHRLIQHYLTTNKTKAIQQGIQRSASIALSKGTLKEKLGAVVQESVHSALPQPAYFGIPWGSLPFDPSKTERIADIAIRLFVLTRKAHPKIKGSVQQTKNQKQGSPIK